MLENVRPMDARSMDTAARVTPRSLASPATSGSEMKQWTSPPSRARMVLDRQPPPEIAPVVKRVIHTTADFDYAENLVFSPGAVERGMEALRAGCDIVTDTQMAKAGVNKTILARLGGEVTIWGAAEARMRSLLSTTLTNPTGTPITRAGSSSPRSISSARGGRLLRRGGVGLNHPGDALHPLRQLPQGLGLLLGGLRDLVHQGGGPDAATAHRSI